MKNWEFYEDKLKEFLKTNYFKEVAISNGEIVCCSETTCKKCGLKGIGDCQENFIKYLYEEHKEKVKLTRFEWYLLNHALHNGYNYIVKDKNQKLYLFENEPVKNVDEWINEVTGRYYNFSIFNDLFQFIKWEDEEPTSIEKILNNCEVIEDDD